jgi:hypothetical protein
MKIDGLLLGFVIIVLVAFIAVDRLMMAQFEPEFKKLEIQRMVTSNKLASAKIVYENLNHVRDLVQKNMTFPGQKDSASHETIFFDFVTTCVNDLKMKLISCRPVIPTTAGKITTYGYDVEVEGDFFSLGELCSKFENSRRIIALSTFEVSLVGPGGNNGAASPGVKQNGESKTITIRMHLNTYRIKKG